MKSKKTYQHMTDEELMVLVKKGKQDAFSQLYDRYFARMYRYFYRMFFRDEDKASDFAQDLFLKLIEKPAHYDAGRKFETWIFVVASNMCKNEFRSMEVRRKAKPELMDSPIEELKEQHLDRSGFREALKKELDILSKKHREAFLLRYENELAIKEIASVMECSEGTVKSRLFYTLRKLSEKLAIYNPKID